VYAGGDVSGDVTINISGLEEVNKALQDFSARVQRRVVSESLAAGARVFADAVLRNTPVRKSGGAKKFSAGTRLPGFLKRSVWYFKKKKGVPKGQVQWLAGPSGRGYYRYMVEKGHVVGKRLRKGDKGGGRQWVQPVPFIGPAFNAAYNNALQVFTTEMQIGVADAARRAGLRATKT